MEVDELLFWDKILSVQEVHDVYNNIGSSVDETTQVTTPETDESTTPCLANCPDWNSPSNWASCDCPVYHHGFEDLTDIIATGAGLTTGLVSLNSLFPCFEVPLI